MLAPPSLHSEFGLKGKFSTCAPALGTRSTSHSSKVCPEHGEHPKRWGSMKNSVPGPFAFVPYPVALQCARSQPQELKGTSELHSERGDFGKKYTQRVRFVLMT